MRQPNPIPVFFRLALFLFLLLPAAARAQDAVATAQTVIESQIRAFLAGDMTTAYSFASPEIKAIFPTEERFGAMVRQGYGPVYRPGNYAFGRSEEIAGGGVVQEVMITAPDGESYTAIYQMQRQPDGSMKIRGVTMVRSALPST